MSVAVKVERGVWTSPSGVRLAFSDVGPRDAQAVVFVHGIAQSRRCFASLVQRLAETTPWRLVTYDLPGHGESDDPGPDGALTRAQLGQDLASLLEARGLVRPIIAAWSFGGVVVGEYLRRFSDAGLGGVVLLAASIRTGRDAAALFGPVMLENGRALVSPEAHVYLEGARRFLSGSTAVPGSTERLEAGLVEMQRVPAAVRRALLSGGEDYRPEFARVTVPLAALYGTRDAVVPPQMSELLAEVHPRAVLHPLEGVGHVPWDEAPDRFDRRLREVLARCS